MMLSYSWKRYFEMWNQHTVDDSLGVMQEWYSFEIDFRHCINVAFNKLRELRDMMEGLYDKNG